MTSLSAREMAAQLGHAYKRVFKKFLEHEDVSHILCFISPLSLSPRLVPVGKGLEFTTIEAAYAKFGPTASNVFLVDCLDGRGEDGSTKPSPDGRATTTEKNESGATVADAGVVEETARIEALEKELAAAHAKIAELSELDALRSELKDHEANLNSREHELMKMEDELMARLHKHMESLAELEQREDEVAERESALRREPFVRAAK